MADRNEVMALLNIESMLKVLLSDAKPRGKNKLLARCPWGERHKNNDASPSFLAFTDNGNFKCLACGEKGSIFDLYGKINGLDYSGTITELAREVGLEVDKKWIHQSLSRVTGFYLYHDKLCNLLYWKERVEPGLDGDPKDFYFFHGETAEPGKAFFMPKNSREIGRGCDPVLYRQAGVLSNSRVFFTEGEKQADLLFDWALTATTLDSGCSSSLTETMIEQLRGKEIIILPDNDSPGRSYANKIAMSLLDVAELVKIVDLPSLPVGGDIIDWALVPSNDVNRLLQLVAASEDYKVGVMQMERTEEMTPVIKTAAEARITELRAFPRLYFDFSRHFDDHRRYYFKKGQSALFDSFMMRIAKSSGVQLPDITESVAHLLETEESTVREMLDTALQHGLLLRTNGYLSSPMITEQYNNAIKICLNNAQSGAKGGKVKSRKSSKLNKK